MGNVAKTHHLSDQNLKNRELLALLDRIQLEGWEASAAQELGMLIDRRVGKNLHWLLARQRGLSREDARLEVISHLWQALRTHTSAIMEARDPWSYVTVITNRQLARENEEKNQASQTFRESGISPPDLTESAAMNRLVKEVISVGASKDAAWKILRRCAQICAEHGVTKRHSIARRDWYLEQCGLTPDQASKWMNLLTGSRRSGIQESPLWRLSHGMDFSPLNRRWAVAAIHCQNALVPTEAT